MNDKEIMRNYADIMNESKRIDESLGQGMVDVVQARLGKTIDMIENLMVDIKEEAPNTVVELGQLLSQLEEAVSSIDSIKSSWNEETGINGYHNEFQKAASDSNYNG